MGVSLPLGHCHDPSFLWCSRTPEGVAFRVGRSPSVSGEGPPPLWPQLIVGDGVQPSPSRGQVPAPSSSTGPEAVTPHVFSFCPPPFSTGGICPGGAGERARWEIRGFQAGLLAQESLWVEDTGHWESRLRM